MKIKPFLIIALGLVAIAAIAVAADPITLKRTVTVGETLKYKLTASFDAGQVGSQATVTGDITNKITKIESNGNFDVESTQQNLKIDVGGQTIDGDSGTTKTTVMQPNGQLVEIRGENLSPQDYRLAALNEVIFPDKPVNMGDSWSATIPDNAKTGAVAATLNYVLVSEETVDTIDSYKISIVIKETKGDTPASSTGTVWVSKADGSVVKSNMAWVNAPVPAAPNPITGTYTVDREP